MMIRRFAFASAIAAVTALAPVVYCGPALADAKFIHVPSHLAKSAERLPNPPGTEDEVARWHGADAGLPRILWLQRPGRTPPMPPVAAATAVTLEFNISPAPCRFGLIPRRPVGPDSFYRPTDQVLGEKIFYPHPAWESAQFLPKAGWSERRSLWLSHGQW